MKTYIILNHLGHEVGSVEVEDESYLHPIRAYAAKISTPDSVVTGQKLLDAGYKFKSAIPSPTNKVPELPETTYSLYEVEFLPHDGRPVFRRNLLVPTDEWQWTLDKFEAEFNAQRGRTVLLADTIEVSHWHNFHDA